MAEEKQSALKKRFSNVVPTTETYELLEGKEHVDPENSRVLKPGDTIELNETQAKAFSDKFKKSGTQSPVKVAAPGAPPQDPTARLPVQPQDAGSADLDLKTLANPENRVPITPGKPIQTAK